MKSTTTLSIALLASSVRLFAAPCVDGSLRHYIELGAAGCTISGILFKDFSYFAGNSSIRARDVHVTPVRDALFIPPGGGDYDPGVALWFTAFPKPWTVRAELSGSVTPVIAYSVVPGSKAIRGFEVLTDIDNIDPGPRGLGFITFNAQACLNGTLPRCDPGTFLTLTNYALFVGGDGFHNFNPISARRFPAPFMIQVQNLLNLSAYANTRTSYYAGVGNVFLVSGGK